MKRMTTGQMLAHLRGLRLVGQTSVALNHDRSWLTKTLAGDPDARLSPQRQAAILDALERVQSGTPTG